MLLLRKIIHVPYCNHSSKHPEHIKKHIRDVHRTGKLYRCRHKGCKFEAPYSYLLKEHKNSHTGNRPYPCTYEECDYSGKSPSSLYKHVRVVHKKDKSQVCPYEECDFSATYPSELKGHISSVHKKHRRFPCPFCDHVSSRNTHLNLHIANKHSSKKKTVKRRRT